MLHIQFQLVTSSGNQSDFLYMSIISQRMILSEVSELYWYIRIWHSFLIWRLHAPLMPKPGRLDTYFFTVLQFSMKHHGWVSLNTLPLVLEALS